MFHTNGADYTILVFDVNASRFIFPPAARVKSCWWGLGLRVLPRARFRHRRGRQRVGKRRRPMQRVEGLFDKLIAVRFQVRAFLFGVSFGQIEFDLLPFRACQRVQEQREE